MRNRRKSHPQFSWEERGQKRVQDRFTEIIVFCFSSVLQKWTRTCVPAPPISSCPTLGQHSILLFAFAIWIHHPTLKFSKSRLLSKGNRKSFKNFMETWAWLWRGFSFLLKGNYLRRKGLSCCDKFVAFPDCHLILTSFELCMGTKWLTLLYRGDFIKAFLSQLPFCLMNKKYFLLSPQCRRPQVSDLLVKRLKSYWLFSFR